VVLERTRNKSSHQRRRRMKKRKKDHLHNRKTRTKLVVELRKGSLNRKVVLQAKGKRSLMMKKRMMMMILSLRR
jgi:hypothetical protein